MVNVTIILSRVFAVGVSHLVPDSRCGFSDRVVEAMRLLNELCPPLPFHQGQERLGELLLLGGELLGLALTGGQGSDVVLQPVPLLGHGPTMRVKSSKSFLLITVSWPPKLDLKLVQIRSRHGLSRGLVHAAEQLGVQVCDGVGLLVTLRGHLRQVLVQVRNS